MPRRGSSTKAALSVAYGAGLRAAEVISLKVSDIDSKRMIIRVEQGKGGKDRNVNALAEPARPAAGPGGSGAAAGGCSRAATRRSR